MKINIYLEIAQPFLNELKEIIGEEDFKIYTDNQKKRDHGHYHITVINVMDYNKLSKEEGTIKIWNYENNGTSEIISKPKINIKPTISHGLNGLNIS